MRTNIEVDLKPFEVPIGAYLSQQDEYHNGIIIPLNLVPLETLEELCAEFTRGVLEKAGYTVEEEQ